MTEKLQELDFDVSHLIAAKVFMSKDQFDKEFDAFCRKHYYYLDEENKDEYYYKVEQTYHLFSSIDEAQYDAETALSVVNLHPCFKRIFKLLLEREGMSHDNLAQEVGLTVHELNLEMSRVRPFGWFYELATANSINASDCFYSVTKFGKLVYDYILREEKKIIANFSV